MLKRLRRSFTPDFKREAANLVLKEGYSVAEACQSLDIGEPALRRWIDQLEGEQRRIQELEAQVRRHEHLSMASADLFRSFQR